MQERRAEAEVRAIAASAPGARHCDESGLQGRSVVDRYCAWRGASDQRYVASIFPVDSAAADGGLPAFDGIVLIAVARREGACRILFARAVERAGEARCAVARGLAEGADEWHVHFLAQMPAARAAIVADLSRRHPASGGPASVRSASPMGLRLAS